MFVDISEFEAGVWRRANRYQYFLPEKIKNMILYHPQDNQREKEIRERLANLWKKRYGY